MKHMSFFTGAMGLDLGLEQAGWECVFANEADPVACKTVRLNRPDLNLAECDVRALDAESVRAAAEGFVGEIDLVVGGPPCQAFSTAGKRLGLSDDRGNVFLHFLQLAVDLAPKIIIVENVRGLLSAPLIHRPHLERGFGFDPLSPDELRGGALSHIVKKLRSHGYDVSFELYDTANFGVPQRRERFVLSASRVGRIPHFEPTHGSSLNRSAPWRTFGEAVQGLRGHQDFVPLREKQLRFIKLLRAGQNWRNLPEAIQREALGRVYECSGGRTGFYRRLAWDKPAPTLVTNPTMPATLLAHPVEERPLSVQEYARVQTFPDDWLFAGSLAQKYKQIGNAVPVEFARVIGAQLARRLDYSSDSGASETTRTKSRYRGTDDRTWRPAAADPA